VVRLDKGQQVLLLPSVVVQQPDGSFALPCRLAAREHTRSEPDEYQHELIVVPVLAEDLEVQKRLVETGNVRITKAVHEREALVDEPLLHDHVATTRADAAWSGWSHTRT